MIHPQTIQNAGLVILNPFLAPLFSRLGLVNNGQFIHKAAQQRAAAVLQYIATGNIHASDDDLLLNKVLCGISAEETIPRAVELTNEELIVINELFILVKDRWEKMRNTSDEALRSSFLAREGLFIMQDRSCRLTITKNVFDVLIQTLPWNIGMIKLPWMEKYIYVEWR